MLLAQQDSFYRLWFPKVKGMAFNMRLTDPEAAAQDVVVDFIRSGYADRWDPAGGRSIESFVWSMMRCRLISKRRQQLRDAGRSEPWDFTEEETTLREPVYVETRFEYVEQIVDLRDDVLPRAEGGRPAAVLREIIIGAVRGEPVYDRTVAAKLGCAPTTVTTARHRLREQLADLRP